jgi:hypothetical protein
MQDSQMILRLPRRQPSHITVEANPFMFRMGVFDLLSLGQSRPEVDFQHVATSHLQLLGDVNAMVDEHVVALENSLAIELDGGVGIESIEGKDVLGATWSLLDLRQVYLISPGFVAHPLAVELVEAQERVLDPGGASV